MKRMPCPPVKAGLLWRAFLLGFLLVCLVPSVSWADLKHTVAAGETLYELSRRYGTTVEALQAANGLNGHLIYPGQTLIIPGPEKAKPTRNTVAAGKYTRAGVNRYTVRPGDSLYVIAQRYGVREQAIREANNLTSDLIFPGQVLVIPGGTARVSPDRQVSRGETADVRAVLAMAVSLLGKPYVYGGSGPEAFDCSGFTSYVFRETAGINLPHNAAAQARLGTRVGRDDLSPGDLVFFSYYGSGDIDHVGIYVGQDRFIHASSRQGVKYSSLNESYYAANYRGATRILR
ncbi:peptidoglycan endopeptidase LytE [Desulfofundulus luciae]|uniref:Peptidoglycan endopeptidase LytE n=1 Tax=Desulfofundulus luciae TaxID=74702 RepID=A0ABU0AYX6_9FIRM|nr:C40 family peptidase [Desulfofundulus luciae]MDQ0285673.1 peptidoglycan endopeptidase LytE [Desulfofundulus luciae]